MAVRHPNYETIKARGPHPNFPVGTRLLRWWNHCEEVHGAAPEDYGMNVSLWHNRSYPGCDFPDETVLPEEFHAIDETFTQTDDVLRAYPEYLQGQDDKKHGRENAKNKYALMGIGGRFEKKAYLMGYHEAVSCDNPDCIKKAEEKVAYLDKLQKVQYTLRDLDEGGLNPDDALRRISIIVKGM